MIRHSAQHLPNLVFSFKIPYFCRVIIENTMWQRIQTLYLGTATALIISMFFCRFATIIGPNGTEEFIRYYEKLPFLVLLIMLTTAHIAATASYKAFFLQARVSVIAGLLALGFQGWLLVDFFTYRHEMTFSISTLFPLAAAFLDFIAAKTSMVDEMTIQAIKAKRRSRKK
jgi:hypothetical protein